LANFQTTKALGLAEVRDARDLGIDCDFWITDPPYADAVNYHELGDFFLAWFDKRLAKTFPEWSPDARADIGAAGGDGAVSEMVLEATYQCVLAPWCILQPDAQLIVNPGGDNSAPNAFVIGARLAIIF
jgi:hypothetical protein